MLRTPVPASGSGRQRSRGLSLVELMVGIAIGLLIVAGAALVVSTQLADSRHLLVETQIQQDLRAATDIVTRELRRSGSWAYADAARSGVAKGITAGTPNNFTALSISSTPGSQQVLYKYLRNQNSSLLTYGFKVASDVLYFNIDGNGWQELTDPRTLKITNFSITEQDSAPVTLPCHRDCGTPPVPGDTSCWPQLTVRELVIDITGQAVSDPNVQRSLQAVVRPRNDRIATFSTTQVCP